VERADSSLVSLIRELGMEEPLRLCRIRALWDELFGEPLRGHISPVKLSEAELLVHVDSASWLQQITFLKPELLRKLSPFGVKDVRLKVGKVRQGAEKKKSNGILRKVLSEEELSFIERLSSSVEDPELGDAIRKAAGKGLSRKKY
jgi:hypothetical protein